MSDEKKTAEAKAAKIQARRIANMESRLAKMNERDKEHQAKAKELEQSKAALVESYKQARDTLHQQLASLDAEYKAKVAAIDAEIIANRTRRAELKEDYGELHEMLGEVKKLVADATELGEVKKLVADATE